MRKAKQSTAKNVMLLMVGAADHITGLAGLTLTITASKDGGAFASISPTVTDRGNGWYSIALTASHTDTLGDLALHVTGASADPSGLVLLVEGGAVDVDTSTRLATAGYTAPDNASVAAILVDTAAIDARLPSDPADQSVVIAATDAILAAVDTRLPTASYTAPDNASVTAIKAKTDSLTFTKALELDANLKSVNSVTVNGDGAGTPMGV